MNYLKNKTVIITGASSGIDAASAKALANKVPGLGSRPQSGAP